MLEDEERMSTVLLIVGIVFLGFIVNVTLKQSYNFIFIIGKKPLLWIATMAIVAIVVWYVSAAAKLGVSVPAWASLIALFMNLPPRQKSTVEKQAIQAMTDEVYAEMGIKHGRIFHRVGLVVFAFVCLASWFVLYAEVSSAAECQIIIGGVF
jgi:hypothetical protein